ncbi:MAG: hypothetical protein HRU09_20345, partial [Oligoflexales bacterium]|nr:hypothetical protein [Oligoflexales bacterium]
MGDDLDEVDLGANVTIKSIHPNRYSICAILDNDRVKCWGRNDHGQLGRGNTANRGNANGEMGDDLDFIELGTGRTVKTITGGRYHVCAILDNDDLKCWGRNDYGQLGQNDTNTRGNNGGEMGNSLIAIDLGPNITPIDVTVGRRFTCVLFDNNRVKCFGRNTWGQLGKVTPNKYSTHYSCVIRTLYFGRNG